MSDVKYKDTLEFLFNALPVWEKLAGGAAYKPGTERVLAFARAVGRNAGGDLFSPSTDGTILTPFKTIHIAGTNGKGSTASMLAAVLQSAGYKTGLYTSPHLVDFRERIRVDGQMIPRADVVEFTALFRDEMVRLGMTFFEMATVMALWFFSRSEVDIAVIEAGLGGRHDATNIITPALSVITNIGLEHTQYLGSTVAAIAREKAGIIKRGVPVVVGETDDASAPVFRTQAERMNAPIVSADAEPPPGFSLDLVGAYQQKNLRTVLAAIDVLRRGGIEIPDAAVRRGLAETGRLTGLRARWEVVGERPKIVLDTAHNAHGFSEIARQLASWRAENDAAKLWMVLGFAADKDVGAITHLLPPDANIILTAADSPRAMPTTELARHFPNAEAIVPVAAAVRKALEYAAPDDLIYIGGSNFVVGEWLNKSANELSD